MIMALPADNSYQITGKVCPPKLPMHNIPLDSHLFTSLVQTNSIFTEVSVKGKNVSASPLACALSSPASVLLQSDECSHSSVVSIPYFFCNFCDKHTDSKTVLLQHLAQKHVFQCELCEFLTFTRSELVQHQLQKHLDAKEMQPNLTTKAIIMNTSQLQRMLSQMSGMSEEFGQSLATGSQGGVSATDGNSSLNGIVRASERESNADRTLKRSRSVDFPTSIQNDVAESEGSVSSSVRRPALSIQGPENHFYSEQFCSSAIHDSDQTPNQVKGGFERQRTEELVSSQSSCQRMPHFLDETGVSSSCTVGTSNFSVQGDISEEDTHRSLPYDPSRTKGDTVGDQIPSFLTEPLISPGSVQYLDSESVTRDSSTSKASTVVKILQWCDMNKHVQHSDASESTEEPSQPSSMIVPPVSSAVPKIPMSSPNTPFRECERSSSPNLSFLSGDRLQKQLEEVVSKSRGFLFLDPCKENQMESENTLHQSHSSVSHVHVLHNDETGYPVHESSNSSDISDKHQSSDNLRARFESEKQQNLEHFLMSPDACDTTKGSQVSEGTVSVLTQTNVSEKQSSELFASDVETDVRGGEGERYDILRRLLVGRASETNAIQTTKVVERRDEWQLKSCSSPRLSSVSSCQSNNHNEGLVLKSLSVTRPSDMSLKELLTQKMPSSTSKCAFTPQSVFLVCGYCNLELANKYQFQKHVEQCKYSHLEGRNIGSVNHRNQFCDQIKCEASDDDDLSIVKVEPGEDLRENNSEPSSSFSASDMLKEMSDQYFESNRMDHDKVSLTETRSCDDSTPDLSGQTYKTRSAVPKVDKNTDMLEESEGDDDNDDGKDDAHNQCVIAGMKRKNDDTDYVYESDDRSSTSSTDDRKVKRKCFTKKTRQTGSHQIDPSRQHQILARRQTHDHLSKRQPEIHLSCLNCSFFTQNKANMRQHLMECHPDKVPFAQAHIIQEGRRMLFFCQGVNSSCTFLSSEGAEIFEHIRLCYAGHLDNFIDKTICQSGDFSQMLFSLGLASKLMDSTPVTYYCLRCKFSKTDFQGVAYHVSANHVKDVAGILLVKKNSSEVRVQMGCLVCNAFLSVKEWCEHPCRKLSANKSQECLADIGIQMPFTFSSMKFKENEQSQSDRPGAGGKNDQLLLEEKLPSKTPGMPDQSKDVTLFVDMNYSHVQMKQEMSMDDNFEQKSYTENPSQFPQSEPEANNESTTGKKITGIPVSDCKPGVDDSPNLAPGKSSPGLSVLQNLLTAPKEKVLVPKNFSLLENLLKPPCAEREKDLKSANSSFKSSDDVASLSLPTSISHKRPMRTFEILSRQDMTIPTQSTPGSLLSEVQETGKEKKLYPVTAEHISLSSSGITPNALKMSVSSSLSSHGQGTGHAQPQLNVLVPDTSVMTPGDPSPPLIPHPPKLPALPPLSPSPPPATAAESQNTPGPFTNLLLGLLSKSDQKSKP